MLFWLHSCHQSSSLPDVSLAQAVSDIQYARDHQNQGALKKEIWVLLRAPLFLGKRCGVTTYFFYTKKKKKKNTTFMTEMLHCHWLNKNKYKLDKLNLTRIWVLVTIYQKNTWLFVLVTIYPKIKIKINFRSTYPKKLNSEARLQNWKVLGTHFA